MTLILKAERSMDTGLSDVSVACCKNYIFRDVETKETDGIANSTQPLLA
ncbi:hypothetical protein [Photorhabdus australis]